MSQDDATLKVPAAGNTVPAGEPGAQTTPGAAGDAKPADTAPQAGTAKPEGALLSPEGAEPKAGEKDQALLTPDDKGEEEGAPEAYEFTLPEGWALDGEEQEKVSGLFKGMNISQANAQKLVDYFTESLTASVAKEESAMEAQRKAWREEVRKSPSFASDRALAQKGLNAVVKEPDEKALFTNSWMSDHPAMFRILTRVGRLLGEDTFPAGGGRPKDVENINVLRFPVE